MTHKEYLSDPCRAASLPYWKTERLALPENTAVVRDDEYDPKIHFGADTQYFKLRHDLMHIGSPRLPSGFELSECGISEFATHINSCYSDIGVREEELFSYRSRPVYDSALWIAVREKESGIISATGIAELDTRIGEGVLEWIQVSPEYRRRGLGRFLVNELLSRLSSRAGFVTVSGRLYDPCDPLSLYLSCGFKDKTVWHVIKKA